MNAVPRRTPVRFPSEETDQRPSSTDINVLSVASEVYPLVKTGGLADVVGALPAALTREGVAMRTLIPGYPAVVGALKNAAKLHAFANLYGGPARLLAARVAELDLLVLDAPHLFARPGNPYTGPDGHDWPDNAQRFAALSACAAAIGRAEVAGYVPDVVHLHDWQAGLAAALMHFREGRHPPTVMTVHNLSFQGRFPSSLLLALGLPAQAYGIDGVEFHGSISFLKAGLALADRLTTVSPTYAAEITTPEMGMGFDGLLRTRADVLTGIRNGIDEEAWNPATDPHVTSPYDAKHLARRAANKLALQQRLGLAEDPDRLLFGVVSRLTQQKGMDLLLKALPALIRKGGSLALVGTGDPSLEAGFKAAAVTHPGRVATVVGYDEALAHALQGGVDALLVPSRFEPCGLTQLCALRYGVIPVVARVGGLADTIIDANEMALAASTGTGVHFAPVDRDHLEIALARTAQLWRDGKAWRRMQTRAMATDVGWSRPARQYAALFRDLLATARRE